MNIDSIFLMNEDKLDAYLKSKNNAYNVNTINEKRYLIFYYASNNNELDQEATYFVNKDDFANIILQVSSAEQLRKWYQFYLVKDIGEDDNKYYMKEGVLSNVELRILSHLYDSRPFEEKYTFIVLFNEFLIDENDDHDEYTINLYKDTKRFDKYFTKEVILKLDKISRWTKISEEEYNKLSKINPKYNPSFEAVNWY